MFLLSRRLPMLVFAVLLPIISLGLIFSIHSYTQPSPFPPSVAQGYPAPTLDDTNNDSGYPDPETPYPTPVWQNGNFATNPNYYRYLPIIYMPPPNWRKGLAWGGYEYPPNQNPYPLRIGWYYAYRTEPPTNPPPPPDIEYIPLMLCRRTPYPPYQTYNQIIEATVQVLGANNDGYLLWLNEPETNDPSGCTITPTLAALFYYSTTIALPNAQLIGPHTYHGNDSAHNRAVLWLEQWRDAVYLLTSQYPDMAGYALHPYSENVSFNQRYVEEYYAQMLKWGEGNKELWVTEFGYCKNPQGAEARVVQTVNLFDAELARSVGDPIVTRYAYWTLYSTIAIKSCGLTNLYEDDLTTLSSTGL